MEETQWNIKEIKRLKKIQLVQNNLLFLLLFFMIGYFFEMGKSSLILIGVFLLGWIVAASLIYTLITGKALGLKRHRVLQKFDRHHLGEKRWKWRRIAEIVIVIISSAIITFSVFNMDIHSLSLDLPFDAFPFIGVWLGYNIGEIYRLKKLKDERGH